MRNSSSLDWLRFMHTPNDYRVSRFVRTSYTINEWLHTFFLSNPVIKGVEWRNFTNYYEWIRFY